MGPQNGGHCRQVDFNRIKMFGIEGLNLRAPYKNSNSQNVFGKFVRFFITLGLKILRL